jgi:hypothetical protein
MEPVKWMFEDGPQKEQVLLDVKTLMGHQSLTAEKDTAKMVSPLLEFKKGCKSDKINDGLADMKKALSVFEKLDMDNVTKIASTLIIADVALYPAKHPNPALALTNVIKHARKFVGIPKGGLPTALQKQVDANAVASGTHGAKRSAEGEPKPPKVKKEEKKEKKSKKEQKTK